MSEHYGDSVEHNARMHEEALRRARVRNDGGSPFGYPNERIPGAEDGTLESDVIPTADAQGPLNWAGGNCVESPAYVPSERLPGPGEPITSTPRVDTGLSGVDAIVGHMEGGR